MLLHSQMDRAKIETSDAVHSILGTVELALEEPLSSRLSECLQAIRSRAEFLLGRIRDMAELSSTSAVSEGVSFNLLATVNGVVGAMRVLAQHRKLGFYFDFERDARGEEVVAGDPAAFEDVILRLLGNAIRHTSVGEVRTKCRSKQSDGVRIFECTISDTGPGIPEDLLSQFKDRKLTQLAASGLDLAIVAKKVDAMNGSVELVSGPRGGTSAHLTIRFDVPKVMNSLPASSLRSDVDPMEFTAELKALRVLVAENNDDSYLLVEAYCRAAGHRLDRAHNGQEAIEKYRQGEYDVILMDIHMPLMNGYEATRALRLFETSAGRSRTPIIVLSAEDLTTQVRLFRNSGCTAYLNKPFSKPELLGALRRYRPLLD
jgi:CheY-like chemotaxis protein